MNISNFIETQYRELNEKLNYEFIDLYESFDNIKVKEILSTLHSILVEKYKLMNSRLPTNENTNHYWAEDSRTLLDAISMIKSLKQVLKNTMYAFEVDEYYGEILKKSEGFLETYGGSEIPMHMDKIELYYTIPIFRHSNSIKISNKLEDNYFEMKLIGAGSYAQVFKYKDTFYDKMFALKRAKKDLTGKELSRFKLEFDMMKNLKSPYIVEVFKYDEKKNEYIMEYMDYTLDDYINKNNNCLTKIQRINIINQLLKGFSYIHSKGYLHRDISPKNILIKEYEDVLVIKVADFGLVKIPDSNLTTINTEFKGYFNDPQLMTDGFNTYNMEHETYALTRLIYFVLTGKTNVSKNENINLRSFIQKGISVDKKLRFKNVEEIIAELKRIKL